MKNKESVGRKKIKQNTVPWAIGSKLELELSMYQFYASRQKHNGNKKKKDAKRREAESKKKEEMK